MVTTFPMSTEQLPRVFFDGNLGTHDGGCWLVFEQSKKDLIALGTKLRDREKVLIWMPGDLEMMATRRFQEADHGWGPHWVADPVDGMIKDLY